MTETEAREVLLEVLAAHGVTEEGFHIDSLVRAILARVGSGAVPPQDTRDAVFNLLRTRRAELIDDATTVDLILALVRPEGITLTPDDVALLRLVLSRDPRTRQLTAAENRHIDVLAEKLGAVS